MYKEHTIHGVKIKRAQIMVKGKVFTVSAGPNKFGINFGEVTNEENAAGYVVIENTDISITRWKNDTYLDMGHMIFGPIDESAAATIANLIQPDVIH